MRPVCLGSIVLAVLFSGCQSPYAPSAGGWNDHLWTNVGSGGGCPQQISGGGTWAAHPGQTACGDYCATNCNTCNQNNWGYAGACPNCGAVGSTNAMGCGMCRRRNSTRVGNNVRDRRMNPHAQVIGGGCEAGVYDGTGCVGPMQVPCPAAQPAGSRAKALMRAHPVATHLHKHCANGVCCGGAVGPEYGAVTYPYYTTRGPRDFFLANPSGIGP